MSKQEPDSADSVRLIGRWQRAGAPPAGKNDEKVPFGHDPGQLPGEVEFTATRFNATKSPGQDFIVWDVGSYRLEGKELHLTLANDAEETYEVEFGAGDQVDEFLVTDRSGNGTMYRRMR